MSSLAAEDNDATTMKTGETIHQVKLRHRAEVKALKSKVEKRRKEATRGLKGKQKKLALSELKSTTRQEEADLLKKHQLELKQMQNEGLSPTSTTEHTENQLQ